MKNVDDVAELSGCLPVVPADGSGDGVDSRNGADGMWPAAAEQPFGRFWAFGAERHRHIASIGYLPPVPAGIDSSVQVETSI